MALTIIFHAKPATTGMISAVIVVLDRGARILERDVYTECRWYRPRDSQGGGLAGTGRMRRATTSKAEAHGRWASKVLNGLFFFCVEFIPFLASLWFQEQHGIRGRSQVTKPSWQSVGGRYSGLVPKTGCEPKVLWRGCVLIAAYQPPRVTRQTFSSSTKTKS